MKRLLLLTTIVFFAMGVVLIGCQKAEEEEAPSVVPAAEPAEQVVKPAVENAPTTMPEEAKPAVEEASSTTMPADTE